MMKLDSLLLATLAVTVASCAFGPGAMMYGTFYGVNYSTVGEAEQVRSGARSATLEEIVPLPAPRFRKRLIISVPTFESLRKYRDAVDPPGWLKPAQYARDFFDKDLFDNTRFVGAAMKKRNLYESIEIVEIAVSAPEPRPTSSSDQLYWRFNPKMWATQLYFASAKSGQLPITGDNSAVSLTASTESLIDAISRLAVTQ